MKKVLFMAFAVVAFSQLTFAQKSDGSASMKPAPTKAEADKETKAKMKTDPGAQARETKTVDANAEAYKKAGLTNAQVAAIAKPMSMLDKKKADINNNTQMSEGDKKNGLNAIELERAAILKNSLGDEAYKKYSDANPPAKKTFGTQKTVKANAAKAKPVSTN